MWREWGDNTCVNIRCMRFWRTFHSETIDSLLLTLKSIKMNFKSFSFFSVWQITICRTAVNYLGSMCSMCSMWHAIMNEYNCLPSPSFVYRLRNCHTSPRMQRKWNEYLNTLYSQCYSVTYPIPHQQWLCSSLSIRACWINRRGNGYRRTYSRQAVALWHNKPLAESMTVAIYLYQMLHSPNSQLQHPEQV